MEQVHLKGLTPKRLISFSLLGISWILLLWLNFSISPNFFAHFVVIPALFIVSGISAMLLSMANPPKASE